MPNQSQGTQTMWAQQIQNEHELHVQLHRQAMQQNLHQAGAGNIGQAAQGGNAGTGGIAGSAGSASGMGALNSNIWQGSQQDSDTIYNVLNGLFGSTLKLKKPRRKNSATWL